MCRAVYIFMLDILTLFSVILLQSLKIFELSSYFIIMIFLRQKNIMKGLDANNYATHVN